MLGVELLAVDNFDGIQHEDITDDMSTFGQLRDEAFEHIHQADTASDLNEPREAVEHLVNATRGLHAMICALESHR